MTPHTFPTRLFLLISDSTLDRMDAGQRHFSPGTEGAGAETSSR